MGRKLFKSFGKALLRLDWVGIMGLAMSAFTTLFAKMAQDNPLLFIVISTLVVIIVAQIIGHLFNWIGKQFNYLHIRTFLDSFRLISLDLKNDYDDVITDFKVTLHRASMFGLPSDLIVPVNGSEFNVTEGVKDGRFPAKQPAKVYIAKIPPGNKNNIYTQFLIKDGLMNDAMFKVNNNLSIAVYEIVFEITGKVQDDLISRWYLARFRYAFEEKRNETDVISLKWMGMKPYSKKQNERRNKIVFSSPLKNEKFDLKIYKDLHDLSSHVT